jgi:hypothetical protein
MQSYEEEKIAGLLAYQAYLFDCKGVLKTGSVCLCISVHISDMIYRHHQLKRITKE